MREIELGKIVVQVLRGLLIRSRTELFGRDLGRQEEVGARHLGQRPADAPLILVIIRRIDMVEPNPQACRYSRLGHLGGVLPRA